MQNSLPKIATVILAITAVSFMGMAVAAYYGRPDPIAEMHSPEIDEFQFEATQGEKGLTWTVTPSLGDDKTPKQKETAYDALLEAWASKERRIAAETSEMTTLTAKLRDRITAVKVEQDQDVNAMKAQAAQLKAQLNAKQLEYDELSVQFQKLAVDTRAIRDETSNRREDVIRLRNNLEELRTDVYRLEQLRRVTTDRLLRLQLENAAIERRLEQLNSQT